MAVSHRAVAAAAGAGQDGAVLILIPPRGSSYGVLAGEAKWGKLSVPVPFNLTVTRLR